MPIEAVVALVKRAEELGYESVWIPETWGSDAVSLLAVLAHETSSLKLASGVFNVFSRSAALIAQTAATLQTLSRGRFILGLGASGPAVVEAWHGIPYNRPVERTREYVEVVRTALSGERVNYEGSFFRLSNFRLQDPPAIPVPVYIAALGPRNLRLTMEIADGWLPIFAARGYMRHLRQELERMERQDRRQRGSLDIACYLPIALGERGDELLSQQLAYYIGGMGAFYAEFVRRAGFPDEVNRIRSRWESGDRRGAIAEVSRRLLHGCTLGSTGSVAESRIADYRREGIDLPILTFPHGCSADEIRMTLETLAPIPPLVETPAGQA